MKEVEIIAGNQTAEDFITKREIIRIRTKAIILARRITPIRKISDTLN